MENPESVHNRLPRNDREAQPGETGPGLHCRQFPDDKGRGNKPDQVTARRPEENPQARLAAGKDRKADDPEQQVNRLAQRSQPATQERAGKAEEHGLQRDRNRRERDDHVSPERGQRPEQRSVDHAAERILFQVRHFPAVLPSFPFVCEHSRLPSGLQSLSGGWRSPSRFSIQRQNRISSPSRCEMNGIPARAPVISLRSKRSSVIGCSAEPAGSIRYR